MRKFLMAAVAAACIFSTLPVRAGTAPAISESTTTADETGIEREYSQEGELRSIRFLNDNGQVMAEFEVEEGKVYQLIKGDREYIGWINLEEPVHASNSTNATEPSWGPMLSVTATVGGANGFGNTGTAIAGLLCAALPPGVGITVTSLIWLGNQIASSNSSYTRVVTYYREASGCPLYRWYDRAEFYNSSGSRIGTQTINRKSFIGVKNSPDNPPACRAYGF